MEVKDGMRQEEKAIEKEKAREKEKERGVMVECRVHMSWRMSVVLVLLAAMSAAVGSRAEGSDGGGAGLFAEDQGDGFIPAGQLGGCLAKADGIEKLGAGAFASASLAFVRATRECSTWAWDHQVLQGLGESLFSQGNVRQALRAFRAALRVAPASVDLANNVAAAFIDIEQPWEATSILEKTRSALLRERRGWGIQVHGGGNWNDDSDLWKTLVNLASALSESGMAEQSASALLEAASLQRVCREQAAVATVQLYAALMRLCSWKAQGGVDAGDAAVQVAKMQSRGELDSMAQAALPVDPYTALSLDVSHQEFLSIARHYAALTRPATRLTSSPRPFKDKMLVAYVGSEFGRSHSIMLLMSGVFRMHSVAAVCFGLQEAHPGVSLPHCSGGFRDLSRYGDAEAAQNINAVRANIVVDLNGWTAGHRAPILASRPGTVQLQYMGFPATTGAEYIDYAVSDRFVTPPELARGYSERMLLMPVTYFVSDYKRAGHFDSWPAQQEMSLKLCNHDGHHKFDQLRFDTWLGAALIASRSYIGGAKLVLLHQANASERNLRLVASHRGVEVEFVERTGFALHMGRISSCSVALDSDRICGHTTAANYLYSRVPVVTRAGEHQVARVAAGLVLSLSLHCREASVGIVRDEEEFGQVAARLALGSRLQSLASKSRVKDTGSVLRGSLEASNARAKLDRCLAEAADKEGGVWDTQAWVRDWEASLRIVLEGRGEESRSGSERRMNVVASSVKT